MFSRKVILLLVLGFLACSESEDSQPRDCLVTPTICGDGYECIVTQGNIGACVAPNSRAEASNGPRDASPANAEADAAPDQGFVTPDQFGTPDASQSTLNPQDASVQDTSDDSPTVTDGQEVVDDLKACAQIGLVGPVLPDEAGHRVAKVFEPSYYPLVVNSVSYELLTSDESPTCTSLLAHAVELMVIGIDEPLPRDPAVDTPRFRSYQVPADTGLDNGRAVRVTLPSPLYLIEGERLVVSIQLSAEQERHLCLSRCLDVTAPSGQDWWSNAPNAPYDWQDLVTDFNFDGLLRIEVENTPVE